MRVLRLLRERGAAAAPVFALLLPALTAAVGFAVDGAAIQLERNRLQVAADAAAAAGVRRIADSGAAVIEAQRLAGLNMPASAHGNVLAAADVQIGRWNATTRTFSAASGAQANALRVTTRESTANGNPHQLVFGRVLGLEQVNISATAMALCPANPTLSEISPTIPSRTAVVTMGNPCTPQSGLTGTCYWSTPQGNPIIRIDNWRDGETDITVRVISPAQHAQLFTFTAPRAGQFWVVVPTITMNAAGDGAPLTNIVFRMHSSSPSVPANRINTSGTATYNNRFNRTATLPGNALCATGTQAATSTLVN